MKGWSFAVAVVLAAMLGGGGGAVAATTIEYRATDLTDLVVDEDLWRYEYRVSGRSFFVDLGFDVYFPVAGGFQFEDLGQALPANADWDVFDLQPDAALPADGAYDALALVDAASLAGFFSIDFIWRGTGAPGSQPFEIFDASTPGAFSILEAGRTVPLRDGGQVPTPGSLGLLLGGLAVMGALRRRPG